MKKSSAQLEHEINEALAKTRGLSQDEIQLYMSEACPHFAIALHRLTSWPLATLVDEAAHEEWDGEEYPTIAHVFVVRPDGTAVDVKGPRSVAAIKKDFFDLEEPRVTQVSMDELASMMGDGKPLHACGLTELNAAKRLIKRHADFYLAGS
jgi:hypothetical protein